MFGLRRKGVTPEGVPVYKSYIRFLTVKNARKMVALSAVFAGFMLILATQMADPNHYGRVIVGCTYLGLWCSASLMLGLGSLAARRRFARLATREQVCFRWNLTENDLATLRRAHNIRPEINVNGYEYYSIADFGDVASLLRASEQPASKIETLVRPALNGIEATVPEQLLRSSHGVETLR